MKYREAVTPIENVQKWKNRQKKKEVKEDITRQYVSQGDIPLGREVGHTVKYTESNYEVCEHLLLFEYKGITVTLSNSGKIGRGAQNEVFINETSVSR